MSKVRGFEVVSDSARKNPDSNIILPTRSTNFSAGYDIITPIDVVVPAHGTLFFWTDIKAYMRPDEYLKIVIRSSLGVKKNLFLLNQVGIIDCVPAGTKISTSNGYKLVEDIFNSNDKESVLSFNEYKNCIDDDICTDIWIVDNLELLSIETENGDVVEIPYEKEVYTKRGWTKARNLTIYDEILSIE